MGGPGSDNGTNPSPKIRPHSRTITSLQLNVEEALEGRTWLLLPEGFQDRASARKYPLPTGYGDLQTVALIPLIRGKKDCGTLYVRRCVKAIRERARSRMNASVGIESHEHRAYLASQNFHANVRNWRAEVQREMEGARLEIDKAVASMNDLMKLAREGIEGQMRAHLEGTEWKGEVISAQAFRQCFRMVTQAVKGLRLPSDQVAASTEAVMEEYAASLKSTREALGTAPGPPEQVEH